MTAWLPPGTPVSVEHVYPRQHAAALARVDRHISEAPMLAGATCLRLAHGLCDGGEVELTWVILEADANALDDEVDGRVIEGSRRRLAQLHLETGGS